MSSRLRRWTRLWAVGTLARASGVAVISALPAGLLVGGIGSRVVMRLIALATGPRCAGLITENENLCGIISLSGSLELLVFGGVFPAIAGGLVSAALQPWLAGLHRWRGATTGAVLLVVFGSLLLDPENPDFTRFASPALNVALFAVLFVAFGIATVPLQEGLEPFFPALPPTRGWTPGDWGLIALIALGCLLTLAFLVPIAGALIMRMLGRPTDTAAADALKGAFFYLVAVLPAVYRRKGPLPGFMRLVLLAPPLLLGFAVTGSSVLTILRR